MKNLILAIPLMILSCGTPEGMIECEVCSEDYAYKSLECVHCGEPNSKRIEELKELAELQAETRQLKREVQEINKLMELPPGMKEELERRAEKRKQEENR